MLLMHASLHVSQLSLHAPSILPRGVLQFCLDHYPRTHLPPSIFIIFLKRKIYSKIIENCDSSDSSRGLEPFSILPDSVEVER